MLYIAENVRALRKANDMTQEEVAEKLGVSPQSVSKWERGDTYPDITLLPSIANLYKTSVDALIGMDKINDAEARTAVFFEGQKRLREGDNDGAASIFEEALKLYPDDENIIMELALVLAHDSEPGKLNRAIELCERLLSNNPSENVQYTARAALCYTYLKTGNKDKAILTAQKLPHSHVCRENIIAEIEKNPDETAINACLGFINFRDNAEHDILVIDFGLGMVADVQENDWPNKIGALRIDMGTDETGRNKLPPVRVRDNEELAPTQVRVRYYTDYLFDKEFKSTDNAIEEVLGVLKRV